MLEEIKCNLCGKNRYEVLYKSKRLTPDRIVKCLGCGLVYVNPRNSAEELGSSYANVVYEEYKMEEAGVRISARVILKRLKKLKKRGRILDVGCATGFLLDEARKQGWDVYGVELSKWCVDYAKNNLGLNIFCGFLKDAKLQNNFFDVIVLQNSIEHFTDPKETLIKIRRILKPDGMLCISTPNINSLISKILKSRWWGINQEHIFYFTKRTLYKMLDAAGFVPVKYMNHPRTFSFKYWVSRFEKYNRVIYRILKFLAKKTFLGKRLLTIDTTDQIEVYARKSRKLQYIKELEGQTGGGTGKYMKTIAVLPAYNAAKTLKKTLDDIPRDVVDDVILVDDKSRDDTVKVARNLGLKVFVHDKNKGYGGNQKTCYQKALEMGADIVVMVHPDYQYDPKAIPDLVEPIKRGEADAVFGSRMMKGGALQGGMPTWKHNGNIILTAIENVVFGTYLTEYHSGFRAYSAKTLRTVKFADNSDGFIFDTEIIAQILVNYLKIEEVPIRTRYFDEASTIKLWPSIIYGLGILKTLLKFTLHTRTFIKFRQFE